ncbi:MAG: S46 family peptidase, partial [Bacteroidales bacterium]
NKEYKGDLKLFASDIINKSLYGSRANFEKFLEKPSLKVYENDPLVRYFVAIFQCIIKEENAINETKNSLELARRNYIAALKEMSADKPLYPDANSTMRVTYGQVLDYYPVDGMHYEYFTTHEGILEKEIPGDFEFDVPVKLKELITNKDFGRYGKDDVLSVCFISNNDITGGNSGSPVINANGELIGCAFDGNWEALSSNIIFNEKLQRCICVDARYILFIIDKFAGAGYLLDEMTIIQ